MNSGLSELFKNMKDGVLVFDGNGILSYINHSARDILGVEKENSVGKKISEFISEDPINDEFRDTFFNAIYSKDNSHEQISHFIRLDGKILKLRICTSHISYLNNFENGAFISVVTDLTELQNVYQAFTRYTSSKIVETALSNGGETLGGKIQNISILISDLRGFTATSTQLSPEDLIVMLNHYFSIMHEIIAKYQGTELELLGDGIFASFGAPIENKDHATNALLCALEMQNKMVEVNEWNKLNGFPELEMGIGINSGDCIVGNIGSENSMKFSCIGSPVNLAGRIESYSVGGQVYISEYTKNMINSELEISQKLEIFPKGSTSKIAIYDVSSVYGEYNISKSTKKEELLDIENVKFPFRMLDEKMIGNDIFNAKLKKLSKTNAVIETDIDIPLSTNVMFDISGNLYGKVISVGNHEYNIRFTSKPTNFSSWFNNTLK